MIEIIFLTHGSLGEALYQTATKIIGEQNGVICLSSADLSPGDLYKKVAEIVEKPSAKQHGILIAVDLKGGNTWNIACKIANVHEHIQVVAGMNLGMALSFFTKRQNYSLDQLTDCLIADGNRHIGRFHSKSEMT